MKKNITIVLAFFLLLGTSCDSYLDVNHDPNVLETIPDAKVLLPGAEVSLGNNLMGWDFGFGGGFWVQYWTQSYTASQFKILAEYNETQFDFAYSSLTAGVLADLNKIKQLTVDSENKGLYFVSEALSVYTWQIVTDVWGDVPYSEALKGSDGIDSPKFDEQKVIYTDLLKRVDALLQIDLSNSTVEKKYDFIFAGDLNLWKQFANSLKLKLMLRLSESGEYNNATTLAFVKSASFLSQSAKISGSIWSDGQEGKRHPMREFQQAGANYLSSNVIASKSFLDYLKVNNDPRLNTLFTPAETGHQGAFFGDFDSKADSDGDGVTDDKEKYSTALFEADMDLLIISDWEIDFYIAEVYARASENINARRFYESGVKASLAQHGIDADQIVTAGYAQWKDTTVEATIEQIAMQKWVANANYQHIESFLERNRLKYPSVNEIDVKLNRTNANANFPIGDLTISVNGRAKLNGNLPASPLYPDDIRTRNVNSPDQKTNIGVKVWWNKKVGK